MCVTDSSDTTCRTEVDGSGGRYLHCCGLRSPEPIRQRGAGREHVLYSSGSRTNGGSMSTVDEGLQAQIRTIERQYGKPLGEWIALVKESGLTKHTEIVAMLKSQYGMSHGSAHRVALKAREADAARRPV